MATAPPNTPSPRINHILIDLENVQPEALHQLDHEFLKVHIFVGANQRKLSVDFAKSAQRLGNRAQYITLTSNGPNALDFHIAYYIGVLVTQDDKASFHIISKDAGFDPLIEHLKAKRTYVRRWASIEELPPLKWLLMCPKERAIQVISILHQISNSKPSTEKSLKSWIAALCRNALTEHEISDLVLRLTKMKCISIIDSKLTYSLPN